MLRIGHSLRVVARVTALVAVLALAGCSFGKGDDVDTRTVAEVKQSVQEWADQVVTLIGDTSINTPSANDASCTGRAGESDRSIFYVQGGYSLPIAEEDQLATLARLREHWKAQGWTITDDRTFNDSSGTLTVKTPDGYSLDLSSTIPPIAFSLIIVSPCYKSPNPR